MKTKNVSEALKHKKERASLLGFFRRALFAQEPYVVSAVKCDCRICKTSRKRGRI